MRLANPKDLQLECGGKGYTVATPEESSQPAILDIEEITVHPDYDPEVGPSGGSDIATIKLKVSFYHIRSFVSLVIPIAVSYTHLTLPTKA